MDDDAPPRLRWRLLAWLIGAVILLPVLYVAAAGPLAWRAASHYHMPQWYQDYYVSLEPVRQIPGVGPVLLQYQAWWKLRPVPRSWERQYLVDHLAERRKYIEELRAGRLRLETEAMEWHARLRELSKLPDRADRVAEDVAIAERRLKEIEIELNFEGRGSGRFTLRAIAAQEEKIRLAEGYLRRFDAR